jgi:DNA-directed RNA polymerase subunit M/transcription elongation factor TFIIS
MDFAVRQPTQERTTAAAPTHRCPQCREQTLVLHKRHVSPPRLGAELVTEFYDCDCCDARYQFSPADNRWRPVCQ